MRARNRAAAVGIVAGAVALGVSELVAAFVLPGSSPVVAVGDTIVDASPAAVKDWAISTLGTADKPALLAGILLILVVVAAGIGMLARRRLAYGVAGMGVFAVLGAAAAVTRPDATMAAAFPSVLGAAAGVVALARLLRLARPVAAAHVDEDGSVAESQLPDRRRLLTGLAVGVGVAGAGVIVGRVAGGGSDVRMARAKVALPVPATPAAPLPRGADLRIPGLSPFVTPNKDFYRVDTALLVPRVDPQSWRLRVHGLVDRPLEITYDQLLRRPMTEADITLTCVSNEVGGDLVGNARWLGVHLADLLREAGIQDGADMLLSRSSDGWTAGTPVDVVMDGRDALLAVAMNGRPLPVRHGFPVRQVVPGLYGYVSATKWLTDIKVTRFADDEGYWTPRGWSVRGPIKTESRIDVPSVGATVHAGRVAVAGVAWAQHRGVERVEVQVDDEPWQAARLAAVPGSDTWRQWVYDWNARPGKHRIAVRATDRTGRTQTRRHAPPVPNGASGRHTINVTVDG